MRDVSTACGSGRVRASRNPPATAGGTDIGAHAGQPIKAVDKISGFGMGEDCDRENGASASAPSTADGSYAFTDPEAVERRVWRNILVVIAVAVAAAGILAGFRFMLGVALGGGLALLNYKWLQASLREILATGTKKAPPGTMMQFILRWVIIAVVIYVASSTGYLDPVAILAGLFAPALAVMLEAGYVTYRTLAGHGEE